MCFMFVFCVFSDIWREREQWGRCSPWASAHHPGSLHPLHPSGLEQGGTHRSASGALRLLVLWVQVDNRRKPYSNSLFFGLGQFPPPTIKSSQFLFIFYLYIFIHNISYLRHHGITSCALTVNWDRPQPLLSTHR